MEYQAYKSILVVQEYLYNNGISVDQVCCKLFPLNGASHASIAIRCRLLYCYGIDTYMYSALLTYAFFEPPRQID